MSAPETITVRWGGADVAVELVADFPTLARGHLNPEIEIRRHVYGDRTTWSVNVEGMAAFDGEDQPWSFTGATPQEPLDELAGRLQAMLVLVNACLAPGGAK